MVEKYNIRTDLALEEKERFESDHVEVQGVILTEEYDEENDPTYGQCAITATLVYDMFGGTIHKIRVSGGGTHYFNKINEHYIDLTSDQFDLYDIYVDYSNNELVKREYCGKNADTLKRYKLLVQAIDNKVNKE